MNEILEKLQSIFRRVLENQEIVLRPETTGDDIEEWNSLTHIYLIVAIEKEFKVKFRTAEIVPLKNLGEMVALLQKKLGSA